MRIAIHQPNFFPWAGYFDKMHRADMFVFLDDAQLPKTGGTWSNRVSIAQEGQSRWLTAPIQRDYHGTRPIHHVAFAEGNWRDALLRKLHSAYSKARCFDVAMASLQPLIQHPEQNIARYNIHAITRLAEAFGITSPCVLSSELSIDQHATERLIAIVTHLGGSRYLCGGGSAGYQDDAAFSRAGLELEYQSYQPQAYPQGTMADFIPGLSIIDVMMHHGLDGAGRYIRGESL